MGGKNLCLASQKKKASVTSNGELTLTSLATNHGENIKLGAKVSFPAKKKRIFSLNRSQR